ncbi:MAG: septal ring lytic transglycosylase RlpA family protein [Alphaproteobacteria bacterium]
MNSRMLMAICFGCLMSLPVLAQDKDKAPSTGPGEVVIQQEGEASYYGEDFRGKTTANGEKFNPDKTSAASPDLPLGTQVTVTNTDNGKSVDMKINDRGPYVDDRIIDVSKHAADKLGMTEKGVTNVTVEARPSSQTTEKLETEIGERADKEQEARDKQK